MKPVLLFNAIFVWVCSNYYAKGTKISILLPNKASAQAHSTQKPSVRSWREPSKGAIWKLEDAGPASVALVFACSQFMLIL